jgi:hypothetical protein
MTYSVPSLVSMAYLPVSKEYLNNDEGDVYFLGELARIRCKYIFLYFDVILTIIFGYMIVLIGLCIGDIC